MLERRRRWGLSDQHDAAAACADPAAPGTPRREGGFTVLEVLVAFAIAAPALALLYRQGVVSLGITRTAASYQEAISRAQSRLDSLAGSALVAGERDGDDGGGFHWRTWIVPVASTAPRVPPARRALPYAGGTTLYSVVVEVSWSGAGGARTLSLDTRRLGPALAVPP